MNLLRLALGLSTALVASAPFASADRGAVDCEKKVPAEAAALFDRVAASFRAEDADGVVAAIWPGREGRLVLALAGLEGEKSYTREQATEVLAGTYFRSRDVALLRQGEGCTTGGEHMLVRTYRLVARVGKAEVESTLRVHLTRRKVDAQTSKWFLHALTEA
jgi:hypothetical protein